MMIVHNKHVMGQPELKPNESETVDRASVLVVATLVFTRMAAQNVEGATFEGDARAAFKAAQAFVNEAKAQQYDPATIMVLANVGADL